MWKIQNRFSLIDLSNDLFIIRLSHEQDYEMKLFEGLWMIDDSYLHIQIWVPNFIADVAKINTYSSSGVLH